MPTLGKMTRTHDLRTVWPHERNDFSKWLGKEENLAMLGEAIDIDIVMEELESSVGGFSVDIYAFEEDTGRKIIIENQLEVTNHDHLGKIITYASGKDAEVIIWIVKEARDEHKKAIEWLNHHTDESIGFFLIEMELWQIDNSAPAPKFSVVERPNNWAKTMKAASSLTDTQAIQYEFWQSFCNYAFNRQSFASVFTKRKVFPQHWYDLSIGNSNYHISLTANTQKKRLGTEIYFTGDKSIYYAFKEHRQEIESELGAILEWREKKHCRILMLREGDIKCNPDKWDEFFAWYCEMSLKLKDIAKKYSL